MDKQQLTRLYKVKDVEELYQFIENCGTISLEDSQNELNKILNENNIVIFGAGRYGRKAYNALKKRGIKLEFFCDNDKSKWGQCIDGVFVLPPDYIKKSPQNTVALIALTTNEPVRRQLEGMNVKYLFCDIDGNIGRNSAPVLLYNKPNILHVNNMFCDEFSKSVLLNVIKARIFQEFSFEMSGNIFLHPIVTGMQYFDQQYFKYGNNEIFVDCGAFDGDSVVEFYKVISEAGLNAPTAYAFEPDAVNYQKVKGNVNRFQLDNVHVFNMGVGINANDTTSWDVFNCREIDSCPDDIKICALDDVLNGVKVSFIKMDVEGYELDALHGAQNLIKSNKPKLAISVYHNDKDLYELPMFIKSLVPEYKFFLRHHSYNTTWETICYACID